MPISPNSAAFSSRLEEACSEKRMPLRGRQSAIARKLQVTQQAVRKWRAGEAYPDMSRAIELANWLEVNVVWLLQGTGPKRGERIDDSLRLVAEAIEHLPTDERARVLRFLSFELAQHPGWFANEATARYSAAIDALAARPVLNTPPAHTEKDKAA